jgi:DMSO/TMAO reductase YedYZ molybdopterin-dependent catalytic subunit
MTILKDLHTPIFAAEGVPDHTDVDGWAVALTGMIAPRTLAFADLRRLPNSTVNCRLTSVSGWSVRADWNGIAWRDFIAAFPPLPAATHANFLSPGGYATAIPLATLDHPRVLLAWAVAGEPLEPDYGGPLRMVVPVLWGYKSCKWVCRIDFTDRMVPGYWETRGYTVHGAIEAGLTLDVNTRTRRMIKAGEVTEF